ncbi:XRE family transcriptional regulator [Vibrio profundi]|uniref:XRE family transcriptional regulator n=1 Tax=Vibrio profundi TaxID=1774960 RepID=UPI0037365E00
MDERLAQAVCLVIKSELRKEKITYQRVAESLEVSEVSVKRLLNNVQPLSMQRLISISQLIDLPLSKLLQRAEKSLDHLHLFTAQQDEAFYQRPHLFTLWSALAEQKSIDDLIQQYGLKQTVMYQYLRELEQLGLIELKLANQYQLLMPADSAFDKGAKFPTYFMSRRLTRLCQRVENLSVDDKDAFVTSMIAELTETEFLQLNQKLEEVMFNQLRQSQASNKQNADQRKPYTFALMAAQGSDHEKLVYLPNDNSI